MKKHLIAFGAIALLAACSSPQADHEVKEEVIAEPAPYSSLLSDTDKQTYTTFKLTTDLSLLSEEDKQIIPLLIEAGEIMDGLFWRESFGEKDSLMALVSDPDARAFALANYGPWDRLNDNQPFLYGVEEKPLGSQYYPTDMTKEEFENLNNPHKTSLYTFIKRDDQERLIHAYFHEEFSEEVQEAAESISRVLEDLRRDIKDDLREAEADFGDVLDEQVDSFMDVINSSAGQLNQRIVQLVDEAKELA